MTIAAVIGAMIGSFAAAVAWRLPRGISWVTGRSCCPRCGRQLAMRDLVPVLSWLAVTGKARCCGKRIDWRYPAIEVMSAGAFVLPILLGGVRLEVVLLFVLWGFLAVIILVDLSHRYIPNAAVAGVWLTGLVSNGLGMFASIGGGLSASCGVALVILLVRYIVGRRVGREALGLGDVKLFAAAGPWVGLGGMPILVFAAASAALLFYPLWRRRGGGVEIPFGPPIAITVYLGACISICLPDQWHA